MRKAKMNQPKQNGVCKVPVVMQLEALECGAAALTMILEYYNKWIPLEKVREDCGVSRDGSSARNVVVAARSYGLEVSAYRMTAESLRENGIFPCIIHWEFNHFVVLNGFKGNKAYINDPARGTYSIPFEKLEDSFTGVYIQLIPGESFEPSGKPKSVFEFAKKNLRGTGNAIVFTMATLIISNIMELINPAFSRIFLDKVITHESQTWVTVFFIFLAIFNIIEVIMSGIKAVYSLRIAGKMDAVGSTSYMWKVLHLPMNFFSQRMAGDIQGRQASNAGIASELVGTVTPLIFDVVMMIFYFVIMVRYSVLLTIVGLSSLAINGVISNIVAKKRVNITRVSMRDEAKLSSTTVSGIEMIETIKSSGAENGFFTKWSGYQASVNNQAVKVMKLNNYLGSIPMFVSTLADNAVLVLGVFLVMQGEMTVGMIMAFQSFMSSFLSPAQTLISAGQTIQEMRTSMERLNDVMEYKNDDIFTEGLEGENRKLSGNIQINDLSFGYSPLANPIIKDFNLSISQGQTVAIVGFSGCGKSTMSKLIAGLYKPWTGEILFDGKSHKDIPPNVFHASLAVVDQDIILFEDTIANNIKMWDQSIEDFEMILAARDAQIHNDIMSRPDGYNHKLIEGGQDFSGGQRQRIEIARVLAQDPTIIVLDEATSALDAKTEYDVVKAIKDRGITCIVIAHRLSTIRSCDQIIVMNDGEIIDRGTHNQLMEASEFYRSLVTSE